MGDIPIGTSDARTQKLWEEMLLIDTPKAQFFNEGTQSRNGDSIVYVSDRLGSQKGDVVTLGIRQRLNRGWLPSGVKVDGNEYNLKTIVDTVSVTDKQFGITSNDRLSEQRAFYNMPKEDRAAIIDNAAEATDQDFFTALDATNTHTIYKDAGDIKATATVATAQNAVTAVDRLTPELLTQLYAIASTGFNRRRTPLMPLRIDGQKYFVLLTHPDGLAELENDTTFLAGQREAMQRGADNPLFLRAKSVWRNIIIMSHENVTIGTGTIAPYVRSHLLGANALGYAWAQKPIIEAKTPHTRLKSGAGGILPCMALQSYSP